MPDDIAGLACDEMAESRLVTGSFPQHDWQLRYGPFTEEDFQSLPEKNWTLLVQDVEKHYPPLQSLMKEFDFLPRWRIDDLMVSVAGPGGSVGPHVDQYDVFLMQASGSRRWQISESFDAMLRADCELNVLQSFLPEQDWTLEPGGPVIPASRRRPSRRGTGPGHDLVGRNAGTQHGGSVSDVRGMAGGASG